MNDYLLIGMGVLLAFFVVQKIRAILNRIPSEEAHKLVEGGAFLLDVRTPDEFGLGHIHGAQNIPLATLTGRLKELPKDRPIVVYCASGMRSAHARSVLKASGFDARDLGPKSAW